MDPVSTGAASLHGGQTINLHSVPMTHSASGTTASVSCGTGGLMTPASSSTHSEMGDSDTDRRPGLTNMPNIQEQSVGPIQQKQTSQRKAPKTLIDLPVDVLKEIVKEVNNTNDLVSLSLTCRCLHALAIPHIYSRFDIVWPDSDSIGDRPGVDALTYGLATLVASGKRGNNYARWIRKFSLGNGPPDWVDEYNVSKESGKMLGTLINLALMRMENLETFNWDMPTGILRDIFMTLHDHCPHSLKNVHVRFHDNSETTIPASQDPSRRVETPTFKGFKALRHLSVLDIDERQYLEELAYAIEHSVDTLKELRIGLAEHVSKTGHWIWDLDDGDFVESLTTARGGSAVGGVLGVLVSRICEFPERRRRLRENTTAGTAPANTAPQPVTPQQLVPVPAPAPVPAGEFVGALTTQLPENLNDEEIWFHMQSLINALPPANNATSTPHPGAQSSSVGSTITTPTVHAASTISTPTAATSLPKSKQMQPVVEDEEKQVQQLKLETLDLERVPLSVRVLQKAIDWTVLQNFTILNCPNHERLWKALRRKFSPFTASSSSSTSNPYTKTGSYVQYTGVQSFSSKHGRRGAAGTPSANPEYKIRLKKLHTDHVSPALILFIKETLPPNSLEVLFLQENPTHAASLHGYASPVTIDNIFKYCIKRHRLSLRKLLVDSAVGTAVTQQHQHSVYESDKWRFNREMLGYITTYNKMPNLRELGCAVDYLDWHFFLTRLPGLYNLRSLYIPHVKGAVQVPHAVSKEMALQVLDVVSLRNEVEMCYVGIMNKCFELLESKEEDIPGEMGDGINLDDDAGDIGDEDDEGGDGGSSEDEGEPGLFLEGGEDEEEDGTASEDEEEASGAVGGAASGNASGMTGSGLKEDESGDEGIGGGSGSGKAGGGKDQERLRVRLREILFYDDKVAVFKARSGKL